MAIQMLGNILVVLGLTILGGTFLYIRRKLDEEL
jgi:hypothetical protein